MKMGIRSRWLCAKRSALLAFVAALCTSPAIAEGSKWINYSSPEFGFKVSLPSEPQLSMLDLSKLGLGDVVHHIFVSPDQSDGDREYRIDITQVKAGILDADSMDAYLNELSAQAGRVGDMLSSRRLMFYGYPAIEFKHSFEYDRRSHIRRTLAFMIDGGVILLMMEHSPTDQAANDAYQRFINSFALIPIAYMPANVPFTAENGISFTPPKGWDLRERNSSYQLARFTNLTRSIQLMATGDAAYTCASAGDELQQAGLIKDSTTITLAGRRFVKLQGHQDIPKYKVRLTIAYYCLDTQRGAVFLAGSEDERFYDRWAEGRGLQRNCSNHSSFAMTCLIVRVDIPMSF